MGDDVATIPFPDKLEMDATYPTDAFIERVRAANDIVGARHWLLEVFPKFVEAIGYGAVEVREGIDDFGHEIKVVAYSTGGWSGQEALVDAVECSPIGRLYLWAWRRGGHYEFRVPQPCPS